MDQATDDVGAAAAPDQADQPPVTDKAKAEADHAARVARIKAKSSKEPPKDEATEEEAAPDEEATEEPTEEAKAEPLTPEKQREAVAEAVKGGDLKALVKALRLDPETNKAALRLVADVDRKHIALRKKAQHLKGEEARILAVVDKARTEYGDIAASKSSYKRGDYYKVAKALQATYGDDFNTIVQNVARGYAGLSSTEKKALEKAAELEEREAKLAAKEGKKPAPEAAPMTRTAALDNIRAKAQGHDVLSMKRGAELVLLELEDHWDAKKGGFKITIKQAADNVLKEHGSKPKTAAKPPETKAAVPGTKKPTPFVAPVKSQVSARNEDSAFAARVERVRRATLQMKKRAS